MFRGVATTGILRHKEPAWASKAPYKGLWKPLGRFACFSLVLYGKRAPIIDPFLHGSQLSLCEPARGFYCVTKPLVVVGGFGCSSWFFNVKDCWHSTTPKIFQYSKLGNIIMRSKLFIQTFPVSLKAWLGL